MKYTLINIGPSRSASTSLFRMLSKHPNTANFKHKELFNHNPELIDEYIINFIGLNNNTKVLLDATTSYFNDYYIKYFIKIKNKKYINNIKYIHILRNPIDRIKSLIRFKYNKDDISYLKKHPNDENIDKDIFFTYYMRYSNMNILLTAEYILKKENILVVKIDDIGSKKIYDFCDLPYTSIDTEWLNKNEKNFTTKVNELSNKFFNKTTFDFLDIERKFLKDNYGV